MNHFQEQIQTMIDEKLQEGYTPNELIKPLSQMYWYLEKVWKKETLSYENSEQTFLQWANAYEAINGVQAAEDFLRELSQEIVKEVVLHQHRSDALNQMGQKEMRYDFDRMMQRSKSHTA